MEQGFMSLASGIGNGIGGLFLKPVFNSKNFTFFYYIYW
jgi:hypothetical protein